VVGVVLLGHKMQVKKEASGFRRIFRWLEGVDGLILGANRKESGSGYQV